MSHFTTIAVRDGNRTAVTFPSIDRTISFGELNLAANRAANAFRALGLERGDCIAISVTNRPEWIELVLGAQRAGLYYVLVSTKLSAEDLAYVIGDSEANVVIISSGCFALEEAGALDRISARLFGIDVPQLEDWNGFASTHGTGLPVDPSRGKEMLYSSGSTGRPKGVRKPLPTIAFDAAEPADLTAAAAFGLNAASVFYSASPLYHAAPHRYVLSALHAGASVVLPARFGPAEALDHIARYRITHGLWVPTMFHRMLQLPDEVRASADLGSQQVAVHGAAPCPEHVKRRMIDWWGPILDEYYAGSEGVGFTHITSAEWLEHPGSVGRLPPGRIHILDEEDREVANRTVGQIFFAGDNSFEYWRDPAKTAANISPQGWRTFGDIGFLDEDGYLYITGRRDSTIISGGVNIYPQEIESVLLEHPQVRDTVVIGVPDDDLGQEVRAIVQLVEGATPSDELTRELLHYVRRRLGPIKTPKRIVFDDNLPRHETGKFYKKQIVERYGEPGEGAAAA